MQLSFILLLEQLSTFTSSNESLCSRKSAHHLVLFHPIRFIFSVHTIRIQFLLEKFPIATAPSVPYRIFYVAAFHLSTEPDRPSLMTGH